MMTFVCFSERGVLDIRHQAQRLQEGKPEENPNAFSDDPDLDRRIKGQSGEFAVKELDGIYEDPEVLRYGDTFDIFIDGIGEIEVKNRQNEKADFTIGSMDPDTFTADAGVLTFLTGSNSVIGVHGYISREDLQKYARRIDLGEKGETLGVDPRHFTDIREILTDRSPLYTDSSN